MQAARRAGERHTAEHFATDNAHQPHDDEQKDSQHLSITPMILPYRRVYTRIGVFLYSLGSMEDDMAATAESTQALAGTPLERIATIADAIREGGDKAQELRHAPQEAIDAMVDQGLFRFTIPRELGGENASVWETIEVIEAVSAIDGSIGW